MVLVVFLLISWLSVFVLIHLPCKLPLSANVLTYMALSVIDINKVTLLGFKLHYIKMSTNIPHFISLILFRDVIFLMELLIYANVFITATKANIRWWSSVATIAALTLSAQLLYRFEVVTPLKWNWIMDTIAHMLLMLLALLFGWIFSSMARKEGWVR